MKIKMNVLFTQKLQHKINPVYLCFLLPIIGAHWASSENAHTQITWGKKTDKNSLKCDQFGLKLNRVSKCAI